MVGRHFPDGLFQYHPAKLGPYFIKKLFQSEKIRRLAYRLQIIIMRSGYCQKSISVHSFVFLFLLSYTARDVLNCTRWRLYFSYWNRGEQSKMKLQKKQAIIIGILFLITLILNLIASEIMKPILDKESYLTETYPKQNLIIVGNLFNIICASAMILFPLYSFLWFLNHSYIVFRGLKGGILFLYIIAIKTFCFIALSKEYISNTNAVHISFGNALYSEIHRATVVYLMAFWSGALLFYLLLFKSQLVPKWLLFWGMGATLLLALGTIMTIFGLGTFKTMPLLQGMVYFAPPTALHKFISSCAKSSEIGIV